MKKLLIALALILVFAGFLCWQKSNPQIPSDKVLSAIEVPTIPQVWKQSTVINVDEIPIRISWAIVEPKDVELYSNLKEQKLFEEIRVNKNCKVLVNGGFYSTNNDHLGLFVADFETVSNPIQNALLNGFIWINTDNKIMISADPPDTVPRLGLQTGPLLILDNKPLVLTINNDEPERRIAAGVTADDKLIFMVFYREKSEYEGPMLGRLPEAINLFTKQSNIDIVDAINLDGGSHSVFVSNYDLLRELTVIGSYFCAK